MSTIDLDDVQTDFLPAKRMLERLALAREDSDAAYFFDLMYLGEMLVKLLVVELLTGMTDDREHHRYALEYRLLRADGIGEWASVLDEAATGTASQHLTPYVRDSQMALTISCGPDDPSWQRAAVDSLSRACLEIDPKVEETSNRKVSLRVWVRTFVWLRNRTRGHGAPKTARLAGACLDLHKSLALILTNAPAFQRPWAYLKRNLSGKYRVSVFSGRREQFVYLTKENNHSLSDGVYLFNEEPRHANLLFTDPDLTDFFLPNGAFRNQAFECLSYITDERQEQDGSAYLLPVEALPPSETAASPDLDVVGNVFTNMPPRRQGYVKRAALEAELKARLTDDRHPVVTLQGRGGIGKTSLALEVLHQLSACDSLFAIVWFSARDIDLLSEGPRVVKADVLSAEDIARDFANMMRPGETLKSKEAKTFLTECLSGTSANGPFLFVVDNFETIRGQAELYAFLSNAVRLPNKVLITTRTRDFKADYPIEVRGMAREEFADLVSENALRLGISSLLDEGYRDDLFEESGGHPYIAKVMLGEVAHAGHKITVKRVVASKDAMLDALFERSYAALTPVAQRVFLTLCSWRSMVPRVGLEAVLLRPANERMDVERGVAELEQSSLIENVSHEDEDGEFLSVPLAAALFGKKKLVTSPLKIAVDADLQLIKGFGAMTTTDLGQGFGRRIDRLARAIAQKAEKGADLTQELAVVEYIASEYPPAWLTLAELQRDYVGSTADAIHSINRYLESHPDDQDAWRRVIALHRANSDSLAEMHARLQLAELATLPLSELSAAASRLIGLLSRKEISLDADEKRLVVRKLRSLLEARTDEADANDLSRLAWLCVYDHDAAAASKWVSAGLALNPENAYCLKLQSSLAGETDT
ncbi:NB-ARC domain-containing protein [Actinoplanes sp. NPDC051859]|uniref:NB-ARC domain-containing protein n=1 Tax=Actinoplanes sp. NPDC051859 TaxID=3363909 RepID=UPI0037985723